jgi:hypothetical protein
MGELAIVVSLFGVGVSRALLATAGILLFVVWSTTSTLP